MTADMTASRVELRADVERLLALALDVASAEAKLEAFAAEMEAAEKWLHLPTGYLVGALHSAVGGAVCDAQNGHGCSDFYGLNKAQSAQEALDLIDLVIARDHSDESDGVDA